MNITRGTAFCPKELLHAQPQPISYTQSSKSLSLKSVASTAMGTSSQTPFSTLPNGRANEFSQAVIHFLIFSVSGWRWCRDNPVKAGGAFPKKEQPVRSLNAEPVGHDQGRHLSDRVRQLSDRNSDGKERSYRQAWHPIRKCVFLLWGMQSIKASRTHSMWQKHVFFHRVMSANSNHHFGE